MKKGNLVMKITFTIEDYFNELILMEKQYGLEEELYPWIYMLLKMVECRKKDILKEDYKKVSIRDVHNRKGKQAPKSVQGHRKNIFQIMSSLIGGAPDMLILDDESKILGCAEIKVLDLNENDINGLGVSKTGICSWRGKTDNIIIDGKSDTKIVEKIGDGDFECNDEKQIINHIKRFNNVLYTDGLVFYFIKKISISEKKEEIDIILEVNRLKDLRRIFQEYKECIINNKKLNSNLRLKCAAEWDRLLAVLVENNWYAD